MPRKLVLPPIDATPEQIAQRLVQHHLVVENHLMESCGQPNGSQETKRWSMQWKQPAALQAGVGHAIENLGRPPRKMPSLSTQVSNLTLARSLPLNS